MSADRKPFWERPLSTLTRSEWERLCDACGRCCLVKLEDEDSGEVYHTSVACRLLDHQSCRCSQYVGRKSLVSDCVRLTPARLARIQWLPPSCSYRLRFEGKALPPWHPLLTGDPESVHKVGMSVRGRVEAVEQETEIDDLPRYIRRWPKSWPKRGR